MAVQTASYHSKVWSLHVICGNENYLQIMRCLKETASQEPLKLSEIAQNLYGSSLTSSDLQLLEMQINILWGAKCIYIVGEDPGKRGQEGCVDLTKQQIASSSFCITKEGKKALQVVEDYLAS